MTLSVLYGTLSVLYVPAQNFKMKNKATSAYYSRVFNRRCERRYKHWRLVVVQSGTMYIDAASCRVHTQLHGRFSVAKHLLKKIFRPASNLFIDAFVHVAKPRNEKSLNRNFCASWPSSCLTHRHSLLVVSTSQHGVIRHCISVALAWQARCSMV